MSTARLLARPMARRALTIVAAAAAVSMGILMATPEEGMHSPEQQSFTVHPVGRIHVRGTYVAIEIAPGYEDALLGLQEFSHVWVIWWFDRNDNPQKRAVLRVHPRGNPKNPLTGVFATRSPARPNLIGMTLCRIESIEGSTIRVESIDAFDNTPVLDLKPHIPRSDGDQRALVPQWVRDE